VGRQPYGIKEKVVSTQFQHVREPVASFFLVVCIVARRSAILVLVLAAMSLSLRNAVVVLPRAPWSAIRQPQRMRNLFAIGHVDVRRIVEGIAAVSVAALFPDPTILFPMAGTLISAPCLVGRS